MKIMQRVSHLNLRYILTQNSSIIHRLEKFKFITKTRPRIFDLRRIVHVHSVPAGEPRLLQKKVLNTFRELVLRKRSDLWTNQSWIFQQDIVLQNNAMSIWTFFVMHYITVLNHPLFTWSRPCDLFSFSEVIPAFIVRSYTSFEGNKIGDCRTS